MSSQPPLTDEDQQRLDAMLAHVFRPAAPIDQDALFAGRHQEVRRVVDAINQPGQHAIIFGERGVGKTSLANVISARLVSPGRVVAAPRINCDSADTYQTLWKKMFAQIEIFEATRSAKFGETTELSKIQATKLLPDNPSSEDIRRALEVLSSKALLVLIVDEFDRMTSADDRRLFADTIKTLSDHAIKATIVLVGVASTVTELIEDHKSIQRALVQVQMPRMSRGELGSIVHKGLPILGMEIDQDALDHITLLSQGLPHYTHLLALHSARAAIDARTPRISMDHLEAAIEVALDSTDESIRRDYHKATSSPRRDNIFSTVLLGCALTDPDERGYFAAADVRKPIRSVSGKDYDIPSYSRHLKNFCEESRGPVLEKIGAKHRFRFRFVNPLMRPFVVMKGFVDRRVTRAQLEASFRTDEQRALKRRGRKES